MPSNSAKVTPTSSTKTAAKKTTKAEAPAPAPAPAPVKAEAPPVAKESAPTALAAQLEAAQAEIADLKGQVSALSPEPEPEPEPLTMEQRVENCEATVDGIVAALKECFSPTGMPAKLCARLNDRGI